jgi:NAD(P)-dependent dehydrogenase (short-subunit alcohol dehydrogenase family)
MTVGMLDGKVALISGAARGQGEAEARAFAAEGARVVLGDVLDDLGNAVAADIGDAAKYVHLDVSSERDWEAAMAETLAVDDRLDVLVNNAWGGYERMVENGAFTWAAPFWEQPLWRWDAMLGAGVRAAFVASAQAARRMVPARRGLIVNVSHWAAQKRIGNAIYGIAKAATDKLTVDAAHELRPHGVAAVSLYPGLVRTESVLAACPEDSVSPSRTRTMTSASASVPAVTARVCISISSRSKPSAASVAFMAASSGPLPAAEAQRRSPSISISTVAVGITSLPVTAWYRTRRARCSGARDASVRRSSS